MSLAPLLSLWLLAHAAGAPPRPALQSADLVFQTSRSRQSALIQAATHSPLSHVGLVEVTPAGTFVLEAVQPVRRTPWERWHARGQGGRVLVLRASGVDAAGREAVLREARRHLGKPYDARFGWGDAALYCSELVHQAYARGVGLTLGRQQLLSELDLRALGPALRERYGGEPPLTLRVLTPASLAGDARLQGVCSDYDPAAGLPRCATAKRRVKGKGVPRGVGGSASRSRGRSASTKAWPSPSPSAASTGRSVVPSSHSSTASSPGRTWR